MKKLLLLGCTLLGAASVSAASTEYFQVKFNGQEVADKETIVCNHLIQGSLPGEDNYSADVEFISLDGEQLLLISVNPDISNPAYDGGSWGLPQVCEGGSGNCYSNQEFYFAEITENGFIWQIEAVEVTNDAEPVYVVNAMVADGDKDDYEINEDSMMTFYVKYSKSDTAVAGLEADTEAPVYYNLLGKKVTNPSNGVYIVKQGKKVTKQIFR